MSYDEKLAARIRKILAERNDVVEKRMFGGLCFMVNMKPGAGKARLCEVRNARDDGYRSGPTWRFVKRVVA